MTKDDFEARMLLIGARRSALTGPWVKFILDADPAMSLRIYTLTPDPEVTVITTYHTPDNQSDMTKQESFATPDEAWDYLSRIY